MAHLPYQLAAGAVALAAIIGLSGCAGAGSPDDDGSGSPYVTEGKLTIGTGDPAYFPYVIDNEPESGEGFEAAIAYAVAEELGFDADDVVWVPANSFGNGVLADLASPGSRVTVAKGSDS